MEEQLQQKVKHTFFDFLHYFLLIIGDTATEQYERKRESDKHVGRCSAAAVCNREREAEHYSTITAQPTSPKTNGSL